MALGIKTTKHTIAFMSKLLAGFGGAHVYNITLADNRDNGELVLRGEWNSFDNYDEKSGKVNFKGVIREQGDEGWYIEVTDAANAIFIYNTPKNPHKQGEFAGDEYYYNEAGETVKGYTLVNGDIFAISEEGFSGTPEVGKTVTFVDHKYVVATGA